VLGTADTARFVQRFRDEWLPGVGPRYPAPAGEPATPDELMRQLLHTPERMLVPALAGHPAHLHIDLLPPYQRAGHGRALIDAELAALRAAGAGGLHVGMVTANTAARRFYDRVGFGPIDVPGAGPVTYLGLRL
jgi:GNAT superfamily N-acetyltransferase